MVLEPYRTIRDQMASSEERAEDSEMENLDKI